VPARIIGKSEIGKPGDSATSTFISIGAFDTEKEAINCAKYLRTKFLRCLVGTLKITQHTPPAVWAYVPIQDFTDNSDIDWSRSISDIDRQLYLKYGLDMFEQEFIESHIQSME
jgi:type II restriction enzyme